MYSGIAARRAIAVAAELRVVGLHLLPGETPRGGRAAVELVEGAFAEQHHERGAVQLAGPAVEVVVHEATAGQGERLVEPVELGPQRSLA